MQLEYAEKEDSYLRSREVSFHLPARTRSMPHREPILKIVDTSDGTFLACSQDGLMTFWSSQMEMKRSKSVVTAVSGSDTIILLLLLRFNAAGFDFRCAMAFHFFLS